MELTEYNKDRHLMRAFQNLATPCFIIDNQEFQRSIIGFQEALNSRFVRSSVGYSVKTNSLPYCLQMANEKGCFAEVVSADEYELALRCGFVKDRIIYNGPMKSHDTFIDAIINGAIVNLETHREIDWLKDLPNDDIFKVGLRLNVNITKVSPEDADCFDDNSRFGFSDGTDDFHEAIEQLSKLSNIKLSGLHIHRTAHSRSINFYRNSIRFACETINKYDLNLDYLDIGGGYFGIFSDKPTYQQYADSFKDILSEYGLDNLEVIVEPGNALVASCFSFLTEVIDVKHVERDLWFITTDGSRNDIDPFFRKTDYLKELITEGSDVIVGQQIITGCTCLESDRLFTMTQSPLLRIGDRIRYNNVGAYTMCLTPMFIRYLPAVYSWDGEDYRLVRDRWTVIEYLQKSIVL